VSGFISVVSWNWAFWIGAILAGVTWPLFWFFPETYGPMILKRRAQRLRKETGDESIVAPLELEKTDLNHIVTVVLSRPLRMICFEPLVLFTCLYLSYACKFTPLCDSRYGKLTTCHRRHFLHLPPILPDHLLIHLPLQPRRSRPHLSSHRRRRRHLCRHVPHMGQDPTPRPA
jgi:MFS family permease